MSHWDYKTLVYCLQGRFRFWADTTGKTYGPRERTTLVGGIPRQMRQLEGALTELDQEGWELVSMSVWMVFPLTRHGCAVVRRPSVQG